MSKMPLAHASLKRLRESHQRNLLPRDLARAVGRGLGDTPRQEIALL